MSRVIIGYSACPLTRQAFERHGHEVYTCDLLPSRDSSLFHLRGDVWDYLLDGWDFAVLHPMCTYLTVSAAWAYKDGPYHQKVSPDTLVGAARREAQAEALENFKRLMALPFPVAIENPAPSFVSTAIRPPDQIVHPYQFGDDASKSTGLWLTRGTPALTPTKYISPRLVCGCGYKSGPSATFDKRGCPNCLAKKTIKPRWSNQTDSGQNRLSPSADRWLKRSQTFAGIAEAMGDQWGRWLNSKQAANDNEKASIKAAI